jgi:hypothetical protein
MTFRDSFPEDGSRYKNGISDGWIYRADIYAGSDEELLSAVREFLDEAGYSDIPLPQTAERLWSDYLNPDSFSGGAYIFHPVIISLSAYRVDALELRIFNESYPRHKEFWKNIVQKNNNE